MNPMTADVAQVQEKLKRLWADAGHFNGTRYTCEFANFLATRLKGEVTTPEDFLLDVELAFMDLKKGTEKDGRPITHQAADRVPTVEMFVRLDIPGIVDTIFSPEFAAEVKKVTAEVKEEARQFRQRG